MKTINASKFKEQCLALLDDVGPDGIFITKHGKPIAKLLPFGAESADLIGALADRIEIRDDILSTGLRITRRAGRGARGCAPGPPR